MRRITLIVALLLTWLFACSFSRAAFAWGTEGHSIIAEIAQRRLSPAATDAVAQLLGRGHSLASISSWSDDIRDERPTTFNWHFVDIPLAVHAYDPARDCKDDKASGDCVIAELARVKRDLRCADGDVAKIEALKFAVHFVGDVHQPLHTVLEKRGGNDFKIDVFMRGMTCLGTCVTQRVSTDLHTVWDTTLITRSVWNWGSYVDRLEDGWLKDNPDAAGDGSPESWAVATHAAAEEVWNAVPADMTLNDDYFRHVQPVLDRQLGLAGLRLATFLNEAYAGTECAGR